MNRCEVEFDREKLFSLLTGPEFYPSSDTWLQALITNALDACNTRKALEWSFGTEFLEMEETRAINSMREPYEPEIKISYSSVSGRLIIEDNGIGMNAQDIEQYVAIIGKSYYASEEFARQQLDYEPVSTYGIGLLSAFVVSRAILIESKKDKSVNTAWNMMNRASLEAVTAKWMENSGSVEYITSGKEESGSKITLVLKPRYALNLTLQGMVSSIQHFMLYQPIPITVAYDNREVFLNNANPILDNPYGDVLGVVSICVLDELVEGYIWIYGNRQKSLFGASLLYQQGFLVEEGTEGQLIPEWIENMTYRLHVKENFLRKKLSGDGVVRDEKYRSLRELAGKKIIDYFAGNLLSAGPFLRDGTQPVISVYDQEMQFLSKAVLVDVFLKGRQVELPIDTILHGFEGKNIRIAFMDKELFEYYSKNYPMDHRRFLRENKLIVFEKNREIFCQMLSPYVRSHRYVISEYPGILYTDMVVDLGKLRSVVPYRNNYSLNPRTLGYDDIFCIAEKTVDGKLEILVNEEHRLAKMLAPVKEDPRVHRMMSVVLENIKQRILNTKQNWSSILDFGGQLVDEWKFSCSVHEQSVWCLENDFPENINEYIEKCLSNKDKVELGLVGLAFHREDFINWWFAPRE